MCEWERGELNKKLLLVGQREEEGERYILVFFLSSSSTKNGFFKNAGSFRIASFLVFFPPRLGWLFKMKRLNKNKNKKIKNKK